MKNVVKILLLKLVACSEFSAIAFFLRLKHERLAIFVEIERLWRFVGAQRTTKRQIFKLHVDDRRSRRLVCRRRFFALLELVEVSMRVVGGEF